MIPCGTEAVPSRPLVSAAVTVRPLDPSVPRGLSARRRFAQRVAPALAHDAFDVDVGPGNNHLPILSGLVEHGVTIPIVAKLSNPFDRADLGRFRHALLGAARER